MTSNTGSVPDLKIKTLYKTNIKCLQCFDTVGLALVIEKAKNKFNKMMHSIRNCIADQ